MSGSNSIIVNSVCASFVRSTFWASAQTDNPAGEIGAQKADVRVFTVGGDERLQLKLEIDWQWKWENVSSLTCELFDYLRGTAESAFDLSFDARSLPSLSVESNQGFNKKAEKRQETAYPSNPAKTPTSSCRLHGAASAASSGWNAPTLPLWCPGERRLASPSATKEHFLVVIQCRGLAKNLSFSDDGGLAVIKVSVLAVPRAQQQVLAVSRNPFEFHTASPTKQNSIFSDSATTDNVCRTLESFNEVKFKFALECSFVRFCLHTNKRKIVGNSSEQKRRDLWSTCSQSQIPLSIKLNFAKVSWNSEKAFNSTGNYSGMIFVFEKQVRARLFTWNTRDRTPSIARTPIKRAFCFDCPTKKTTSKRWAFCKHDGSMFKNTRVKSFANWS